MEAGRQRRHRAHRDRVDGIDLLLVAPATANIIGKFANGIADDFLSSLYLATRAPVLIAPAMNTNMFEHPAVQREPRDAGRARRALRRSGRRATWRAAGSARAGSPSRRTSSPRPSSCCGRDGSTLRGRRVLVTAGPTYEDIDPVRFVGNRSSGRMGFALAAEALRRGAHVTLVAGPTHLDRAARARGRAVRSAAEMHAAVMARAARADVVVMAAAVADYTPAQPARAEDRKKATAPLTLTLAAHAGHPRRPRASCRRASTAGRVLVGFAAETDDVVAHAREKLRRKKAST